MGTSLAYQNKAASSIKWTTIGELSAKIIVPIINMILARLLSPVIFGLVASVTVVINFAEIISDSGFSRYILQQKFASEQKKKESVGTAIIISFLISSLIFLIIAIFSSQFSELVGAPGCEKVLIFAAAQIPFYAITSIQISLFRRDFKFGILAFSRVSSCVIQLITSCLTALFGGGIWSIPCGYLSSLIWQFLIMIIFGRKTFSLKFSLRALKEMWACSGLFLISSFVVWANSSIDVVLASHFLGPAESGFIKNGFSTASGIINLLTAIYSPVLISLLAKLDPGSDEYSNILYRYQKSFCSIFVPLGIGIFVYQDFASLVFFGSGWEPAAIALGCKALLGSLRIASGNFVITAWTAKGTPGWIFLADSISTILLAVAWISTRGLEYHLVVIFVSLSYFPTNFLCLGLCKKTLKVSALPIIKNTIQCIFPGLIMGLFGHLLLQVYDSFIVDIFYVCACILYYFVIIIFAYPDFFAAFIGSFVSESKIPSFLIPKNEYFLKSRNSI